MSLSIRRMFAMFTTITLGTAAGLFLLRDRDDDMPAPPEVAVSEAAYNPSLADLRLRVTLNGQRGFIDGGGKTVIEPKFAMAMPFSEGLAAVAVRNPIDGKPNWQFVDASGHVVIAHVFIGAQIGMFHEGLAPILLNGKWGYIDTTGKFTVNPMFDAGADFSQGLASVRVGAKYGVIDRQGKYVLEPTYDFIGDYADNFALFAQNDKFGYLDRHGQVAIAPAFDSACDFSEGLAFVETYQGKISLGTYIDSTGRKIFEPRRIHGGPFQQGLAPIESPEGACFIDPTGRIALQCPGVEKFGSFSEGLAPAVVHGATGFINLAGLITIPPQWQDVGSFTRGVCKVNSPSVRGYINTSGQYIWKLRL